MFWKKNNIRKFNAGVKAYAERVWKQYLLFLWISVRNSSPVKGKAPWPPPVLPSYNWAHSYTKWVKLSLNIQSSIIIKYYLGYILTRWYQFTTLPVLPIFLLLQSVLIPPQSFLSLGKDGINILCRVENSVIIYFEHVVEP